MASASLRAAITTTTGRQPSSGCSRAKARRRRADDLEGASGSRRCHRSRAAPWDGRASGPRNRVKCADRDAERRVTPPECAPHADTRHRGLRLHRREPRPDAAGGAATTSACSTASSIGGPDRLAGHGRRGRRGRRPRPGRRRAGRRRRRRRHPPRRRRQRRGLGRRPAANFEINARGTLLTLQRRRAGRRGALRLRLDGRRADRRRPTRRSTRRASRGRSAPTARASWRARATATRSTAPTG